MRKGDLKDYVGKLVADKRNPIEKAISEKRDVAYSVLRNKFFSIPDVKAIRDMAEDLAILAESDDKRRYNSWDISRLRSDFVEGRASELRSGVYNEIRSAIRGEHVDKTFYGMDISQEIREASEFIKPLQEESDKLYQLLNEMNQIITVASSGKQAYKNLIAAGVDMTGFVEGNTLLPVTVKLTIDPSILKGDNEQ